MGLKGNVLKPERYGPIRPFSIHEYIHSQKQLEFVTMRRLKFIAATARRLHSRLCRHQDRSFRSQAALHALESYMLTSDNHDKNSSLVLYNYPSFAGAYAALFARRYHSLLRLPSLFLPFSSVEPLRLEDFELGGGLQTCYLLDFIGPKSFALELSRIIPKVIVFDHRHSSVARLSQFGKIPANLEVHIDASKTSARAVHNYFMKKLTEAKKENVELLEGKDRDRVANVLKYIEDVDLRRFELPDVEAFKIGIREEMGKLNCVTNPYVFEQLLEIDCEGLIAKGKSYVSSRHEAANQLLGKPFKIRLGRGAYGECLAIRADGNSNLSHEMCLELSRRSAKAGLRPIGAVIFMQRNNLKMCLRSTDSATDTSEIAKAYGGGGKPSSSSFIIRIDEYNHWTAVNWS